MVEYMKYIKPTDTFYLYFILFDDIQAGQKYGLKKLNNVLFKINKKGCK